MARAPAQPPQEDLFDLVNLQFLLRRRWVIVLFILFFLLLGVFQVRRTTPIYTSDAVLKYEPAAGQVVDFGERSRIIYSRDEIRTSAQLIRTPAIAAEVLAALDDGRISEPVKDDSPLARIRDAIRAALREVRGAIVSAPDNQVDPERLSGQTAIRNLLNAVSVSIRPDTRLIEVRVSMSDPATAERVCDEFCHQFIRRLRDERRESFSYARDFMSQQIDLVRQSLEEAETALFEYGGQADLSLMESDRELAISTLNQLNAEIERLRNEVALLEAEADPDLAETMARQTLATERQSVLAPLIARRDQLLVRQAEFLAENNEDFLPLLRVRREISAIEDQITRATEQFVEAYVASRSGALQAARQRLEAMTARLRDHQEKVNAIEQRMIRFRVLQREIESTQEVYNALLDRFKRLEITDQAAIGTVTIESPASIPVVPTAPHVTRILAMFMGFGFVFGCGVVLVLHKLDRSVKDPAAVEKELGLPALGHIPCLRPKKAGKGLFGGKGDGARILPPFERARAHVGTEAFRYLRTSISYSDVDAQCQVLLVTSCLPSEGKSTVSSNLGIFFGEQGRKVLLIDGDLKKPTVHRTFNVPRVPGLSDVLTGQAEFEDAVHHTSFEHFDVLPAGLATPSPATLLESRAMGAFIERMRRQYETIIIDSSPADGMADTLVLARVADGIVLTVRAGHTPVEVLARVGEKMDSMNIRILGCVYNSTEPTPFGAQYGRYYGKYVYGSDS